MAGRKRKGDYDRWYTNGSMKPEASLAIRKGFSDKAADAICIVKRVPERGSRSTVVHIYYNVADRRWKVWASIGCLKRPSARQISPENRTHVQRSSRSEFACRYLVQMCEHLVCSRGPCTHIKSSVIEQNWDSGRNLQLFHLCQKYQKYTHIKPSIIERNWIGTKSLIVMVLLIAC